MEQTLEKLQILYEIALSVGGTSGLESTAQNTLEALVRRLDCVAGSVLALTPPGDPGLPGLEPLALAPEDAAENTLYARAMEAALAADTTRITEGTVSGVIARGGSEEAGSHYLLALPGFGMVVLVKRGPVLPDDLLNDLEPICDKLALACTACVARQTRRNSEDRASEALAEAENANRRIRRLLVTIAMQHAAIRELSTPVLQVWDGVLVIPLIGTLDAERNRQLSTSLLEAVAARHAKTVIIDITGLELTDTTVADSIQETVRGCQLLGATCMVTGMRPEVAQTLVRLNVSLGAETAGTLQAGLARALRRLDGKDGQMAGRLART